MKIATIENVINIPRTSLILYTNLSKIFQNSQKIFIRTFLECNCGIWMYTWNKLYLKRYESKVYSNYEREYWSLILLTLSNKDLIDVQ